MSFTNFSLILDDLFNSFISNIFKWLWFFEIDLGLLLLRFQKLLLLHEIVSRIKLNYLFFTDQREFLFQKNVFSFHFFWLDIHYFISFNARIIHFLLIHWYCLFLQDQLREKRANIGGSNYIIIRFIILNATVCWI